MIEAHVAPQAGGELPKPVPTVAETAGKGSLSEILRPPYTRRTIMLILLNFFQAIGFFGFNNWTPALMESRGASFVKSLQYSFFIATLFPITPLFIALFADRIERKWQVMIAAICVAGFALAFSQQIATARLVVFGGLLAASTMLLSYAFHAYMSVVFPTRVLSRAIGFVFT